MSAAGIREPPADRPPLAAERDLAGRAWAAWSGPRAARLSRALVLGALALIFLHAAATLELVYTIRISYALLVAACVAGFPHIPRGAEQAPSSVRWLGAVLVAL